MGAGRMRRVRFTGRSGRCCRKEDKHQYIQVDGGSEFMGDFEDECAERKPPLKVLPPHSPELNGVVERTNRTAHSTS